MIKYVLILLCFISLSVQTLFASDLIWTKNTKNNNEYAIVIENWVDTRVINDNRGNIIGDSKEEALQKLKQKEGFNK